MSLPRLATPTTLTLRLAPLALARRPRLLVWHSQRRNSTRLTKEILQAPWPAAEKLEATGLWTLKRSAGRPSSKGRPQGDKARVNIVSQKLCDDLVKYMGRSLERHAGCDLITIYPGAGVWSRALHDVLQPRSHILMEPDADFYKPFLQPLLDRPGTTMVPNSGIIWSELNEVLTPTHLPHQVERTADEPPVRNDTLLVTANLAFFPKKKFRNFSSVANLVLYQLISSIRASSLFQKYGLVRMLIWVGDDEKPGLLPRSVQRRRRLAIESELATDWITEVCGADQLDASATTGKAGWYFRDRQIELESCRNIMDKMTERGIHIPAGRETKLVRELLALDKDKQELGAAGSLVAVMDRPYRAELEVLEADFSRGAFTTSSDKYERLKRLRYRSHWDAARGNKILDLLREQDAIVDMMEGGASVDQEAVRAREKDWNDRVQSLNKHLRLEFLLGRDNLHVFRQNPPVLSWDRRELEPLTIKADEFYPNIPLCLLDIQPKAMHPLMRDIGPQSNHGGDTFELILGSLAQNSTFPMAKALETVWPGAAEGVIPHCPSLLDRSQGGTPLGGWGQVSPRVLNERQLSEVLEAWVGKWLFKPTFSELVGRVAEDTDEESDGDDDGHRSRSSAIF